MIGGAVQGGGGRALGAHLRDAKDMNESTRPGSSRGLMSDGIADQVAELTDLAEASGHRAPLRHVHASPPPGAAWTDGDWDRYWGTYERAMGLEGCAYSEAVHGKPGEHDRPEHRHRVYLALTERGTLVRTGWDYARQEAVSRIAEVDTEADLVKGKHNIRAARIAAALGRDDVAAAMRAAGLLDGSRAMAAVSPAQRAQAERTRTDPAHVQAAALAAWRSSDSGAALQAALAERGLRLAAGDKPGVAVLLDAAGGVHSLARTLAAGARTEGADPIRAAAVRGRLAGVGLPTVDAARQIQRPDNSAGYQSATQTTLGAVAPLLGPPNPQIGGGKAPAPPTGADVGVGAASQPAAVSVGAPRKENAEPAPMSAPTAPTRGGKENGAPAAPTPAKENTAAAPPALGSGDAIEGVGEPPGPGASHAELAAYRLRLARYDEQRARAAAAAAAAIRTPPEQAFAASASASSSGGTSHAPHQHQDGSTAAEFRDLAGRIAVSRKIARRRADTAAARVAGHTDLRVDRGDPARPENTGSAAVPGQPRDDAGDVRGASHGAPDGGPDRPAVPPRPSGAEGAGAARPGDPVAHGDRRGGDPRRAQAGRARIQDRRIRRGLAVAAGNRAADIADLTARLRTPVTPDILERERMARARVKASIALADSARHTAAVLAREPWPDRASRDAERVADGYVEDRAVLAADRIREAAAARAEADHSRRRVGLVDRLAGALGVRTRAVVQAEVAEAEASRAEAARVHVADPAQQRRVDAHRATVTVVGREAERAAWKARPVVAQALLQAHADQLVREAVAAGDPTITRLAGADLQSAREEVLRREAEQVRAAAEFLRREEAAAVAARQAEHAERMHGYGGGGPRPPGRR